VGDHAHREVTAEGVGGAHPLARPSRRSVVKGSLVAIAGAIGWGAGAATRSGGGAAATATASGTMTLDGVRWRSTRGGQPGGLAAHGELVGRGGAEAGSFSSTRLAVPASAASGQAGAELQTFNLGQGTIFGMGTPPARGEGIATFAILGGTGSYAGATGTYTQEQRPTDRGGDGTARFEFTFANPARD
jgi:hypothetical protein